MLRRELEQKKLQVKHAIEEKTMLLSSLKQRIVGMDSQIATQEEKNKKKRAEAETITDVSKQIKSRILAHKERGCELDLRMSRMKEENQKLDQSLVRSPMKIISEKDRLERELERLRDETTALKAQQSTLARRLELFKMPIKCVRPAADDLNGRWWE